MDLTGLSFLSTQQLRFSLLSQPTQIHQMVENDELEIEKQLVFQSPSDLFCSD